MNKRKKLLTACIITIVVILLVPFAVELVDSFLTGVNDDMNFQMDFSYKHCLLSVMQQRQRTVLFALFMEAYAVWMIFLLLKPGSSGIERTDVVEIANDIYIPKPAGNGQCGSEWFMSDKEMDKIFETVVYMGDGKIDVSPNAGIIVDYRKKGKKEYIRYLTSDVNTYLIGPTRRGKGRRLLLTSTWLDILAGINLCVVDVKKENWAYTNEFAKANGYEVFTYDFRHPEKSNRYNNLSNIVELLKNGKISEAVDEAWDIVSVLVGEAKGEKIWTDGQCATIAAAILIVAQDAPEGCKNLPNVYYFLAYMCESDPETGEMPINSFLDRLPENHPARGAFQVAKIAPFRTRSSFFTSALATLRLYTIWNIADISKESDYTFDTFDEKKVIVYLILPDEKTKYYELGAIYMKQLYESLVKQALRKGGELDRKFLFRIDELGNFPEIPGLGTMVSAGAGRNIFFELVVQDDQQMEKFYPHDYKNIKTNCQLTICLGATDENKTKSLSQQLGTYTVQMNSASVSQTTSMHDNVNYGSSSNLGSRPLMYPAEIARLDKPDALIIYGGKKKITYLPDLSEYYANEELGLGSKKHNKKLFLERVEEQPEREVYAPELWGIWNQEKETVQMKKAKLEKIKKEKKEKELKASEQEEKVSFLN